MNAIVFHIPHFLTPPPNFCDSLHPNYKSIVTP